MLVASLRWHCKDGEEDMGFLVLAPDGLLSFIGEPDAEKFWLVKLEPRDGTARFAMQAENGEQAAFLLLESPIKM